MTLRRLFLILSLGGLALTVVAWGVLLVALGPRWIFVWWMLRCR